MNSAKKDPSVESPETVESLDERRQNPDSQARDRRVIARISQPEMRTYFSHMSKLTRLWVGLSVAYVAALFAANVSGGKMAMGRSLFYGVVVTVIAICVHRFERSLRSYMNSESQAKLVVVSERLFLLLFVSMILGAVMGIVHLVTLF